MRAHSEHAELKGVDPHAWLVDTHAMLVNRWPASRIDDLMPWAYDNARSCSQCLVRRDNLLSTRLHVRLIAEA